MLAPSSIEAIDAFLDGITLHVDADVRVITKPYGLAVHHDEQGRIAIYARGSRDYVALTIGKKKAKTVLKAMRNKRAEK